MAHRPHPKKARTNPRSPRGWSTCMRCGFVTNLYKLENQSDWRGLRLMPLNIFVCDVCLDEPQRQLGTIILSPDPLPLPGALPEPYAIDEIWPRLMQGGQPRYLQRSSCSRSLQASKYFEE
jgi:hypothetical protein